MRLRIVGLLHLFNDDLAEPVELNELLFAGGGADVVYDSLSDLVAVAHRLGDLQDRAVFELFGRTNRSNKQRLAVKMKKISRRGCA